MNSILSFSLGLENQTANTQRLSRIYALYRIVIVLSLSVIFLLTLRNPLIGGYIPSIYAAIIMVYLFVSLLAFSLLSSFPKTTNIQNFINLILDVVVFTLMLYANGGPSIQVSLLYLVTVIAAFILLGERQAIIIMLFAVIGVVYQQFYLVITDKSNVYDLSGIAFLALTFIGTGLLSNLMTRRLRKVELIAENQANQMTQMHMLNQHIIDTMNNGVVIINQDNMIELSNNAAQDILDLTYVQPQRSINDTDKSFSDLLMESITKRKGNFIFTPNSMSRIQEAISVSIHRIDQNHTLCFLERASKSKQQAQQMKLASLGRLTASIAHEIRNPIGAISQASQLLQEESCESNKPIYDIIHKQTQRVNRIIEDILKLSRKSTNVTDTIVLYDFISQCINDHFHHILIECYIPKNIIFEFNKSQLEQVLVNLIQNALRHAKNDEYHTGVRIIVSAVNDKVHLDVIDNGDGVSTQNQDKLFEPFFTTEQTGTGLGLYLSRAFCEANGASLSYVSTPSGACFRISKLIG